LETNAGGRFFNNPYTAAVDAVRRGASRALPYLTEADLRR